MNRQTLIDSLHTQVWQQIRNQSPYSHVFGSNTPIPDKDSYPDKESFIAALQDFVEGLEDTFNLPDDKAYPVHPEETIYPSYSDMTQEDKAALSERMDDLRRRYRDDDPDKNLERLQQLVKGIERQTRELERYTKESF